MFKTCLAALAFFAWAGTVCADELPKVEPEAVRLSETFVAALHACDKKKATSTPNEHEHCVNVRLGMLDAYLSAAGRCHTERNEEECASATTLRPYTTKVLEALAAH